MKFYIFLKTKYSMVIQFFQKKNHKFCILIYQIISFIHHYIILICHHYIYSKLRMFLLIIMYQQKFFQNYSQQLYFQKLQHCLIDLEGEIKFSTNNSKVGQKKYKLIKCLELFKELHQFYIQAHVKYLFDFTLKLVDNITFLFNQFMIPQKQMPNKKIDCYIQTDKTQISEKQRSKRLLGRLGGIILNNEYCHHCKIAIDRRTNYIDEDDNVYKRQLEDELQFQNQLKRLLCKQQRSKIASSGIEFKIQQIVETMNISFSEVQIFLDYFIKKEKVQSQNPSWISNFIKKLLNKYLVKTFQIVKNHSSFQKNDEKIHNLTFNSQIIKYQFFNVSKKININFPLEKKLKKLNNQNSVQIQTILSYPEINTFAQQKKPINQKLKHKFHIARFLQLTVLSQKYLMPQKQQYQSMEEQNGHKIEYTELKKHYKKYKQVLEQNENYKNKLQIYEQKIKSYQNVNRCMEQYNESIKQNQIKEINLPENEIEKLFVWLDNIIQCFNTEFNISNTQNINDNKMIFKNLELKNNDRAENKKPLIEKFRHSEESFYNNPQKNQILPKSMTSHQRLSQKQCNLTKKESNNRVSQSKIPQIEENYNSITPTPTNEMLSNQFFRNSINRYSHSSNSKEIFQINHINKNNINLEKLTKNIFKKGNKTTLKKQKDFLKQNSFYLKNKNLRNSQNNENPQDEKKTLYNFILSMLRNPGDSIKNQNKINYSEKKKQTLMNCKSLDHTHFGNTQMQTQKQNITLFPRKIFMESLTNKIYEKENPKVQISQKQSIIVHQDNQEKHDKQLKKIIKEIQQVNIKCQSVTEKQCATTTDELKNRIKAIIKNKIQNHKNCVRDGTEICGHLKKYYEVLKVLSEYKNRRQILKLNLHQIDKIQQFQNK